MLNWASICRNQSVGQNGGSLMLTAARVGGGGGGGWGYCGVGGVRRIDSAFVVDGCFLCGSHGRDCRARRS